MRMVWGTDKDIDNSVYWYERAAKKRHIGAKNRLSKIFNIKKVPPLFPRVEEPLMQEAPKQPSKETSNKEEKTASTEDDNLIEIGQFFETSLKVGIVIEAQEVPKSKKLLKLQIDLFL